MSDTPISLVVTDLDGTLWDRRGTIHAETLAALAQLEQRGIPVLAATARRPFSVTRHFASNHILLPAVLFDGSLGRDFRSGVTFHRQCFDPETAAWVLSVLDQVGIEPCANVDRPDKDMAIGSRPSTVPDHLREVEAIVFEADLQGVVQDEEVFSFIVCGHPREDFLPAARALEGRVAISISRDVTFGGYTLSVRPRGVTKWAGVLSFCAHEGLDAAGVLAVGDGENDLELLTAARIPCAVEGSCEAVLAVATHRVGKPEGGGWAQIIELL